MLIKRNLVTLHQFQTPNELRTGRTYLVNERAFYILSQVEIWTISKNEDDKQERSRQCYIPIPTRIVYISFGVGYCLLLGKGSREPQYSNNNSSHASFLYNSQ